MNPGFIARLLRALALREGVGGSISRALNQPYARYRQSLNPEAEAVQLLRPILPTYKTPPVVDWNRMMSTPEDFPKGMESLQAIEKPDLIVQVLKLLYGAQP